MTEGPAETAATDPAPEPDPVPDPAPDPPVRRRLLRRDPLAAVLIGVLTLLLGFAFAVQVRAVGDDEVLQTAREEDLVRILDELGAREQRLRDQIADQRGELRELNSSDGRSSNALEAARSRAQAIGILTGTVAAEGPGLVMTIRDPADEIQVTDLVDVVQELRGAGAETMQIDGVRVGVSSSISGTAGALEVDGQAVNAPYDVVVIGSPRDMATAMSIPGGVVPSITGLGGSVTIDQFDRVVVDALRPLDRPQYASPDTDD